MGSWRASAIGVFQKTKIRIANIGVASVLAVTGLGGILPMLLPAAAHATPTTVDISTVQQLCDAINNQADGQTWDIAAGNYGLSQCNDITAGGQTGWYFPITASNITINGIGDPTIYGTGFTQNGAWATQDLVAVFGNNVTLNGMTLMDKIEPNKTIEVLGNDSTIENVTIAHNTLVDQSEYNQTMNSLTNEEAQQWNGSIYYNDATGTNTLTNVNITNGGIAVEAPAATVDMNNVNLSYSSNIDWINDYRVYSPVGATINGAPTYTYHVNSTLNNLDSVLANYGDPTTVSGNDVISLDSDITAGSQINLAKSVTLDGNGYTVTAGAGSYTNSALLNITGPNVTINNLTANANNIVNNAVNAYAKTTANTVALNNTMLENGAYGLVVNGADVTVDNLTTAGNFYAGADVDQGSGVTSPSTLTVLGTSHHSDILLPGIYVDDTTKNVTVNDPNNQYVVSHPGFRPNDAAYTLKPAVPAAPTGLFAQFQYDSTHLSSGSGLNKTAEPNNNNLELEWTAPSGSVTGYRILATFPDQSTKTFYQGANPYSWLAKNQYNNGDEFGQHGQGAYTYQVVAVNAGGESQPSASFTLYYETSQQYATISAPRYVNGNFQVTLKAHDTVGFASLGVDVRKGPNPDAASAYINAPCTEDSISPALSTVSTSGSGVDITYTCTVDTSNLVNGQTYYLRATGRNLAGYYFAEASSPYAEFTYDTTAPTVKVNLNRQSYAFSGETVSSAQKPEIEAFDKYLTKIEITKSNGAYVTSWTNVAQNVTTYKGISWLGDGSYIITAYDAAGNASTPFDITIDNTPPAVPTSLSWLDTNSNPAGNGYTNVQKGTLSWQDSDATVNHYVYKFWTNIPGYYDGEANAWTTDSSQYITTTPGTGGSIWTNFDNDQGTYYFCVEAVDAVGNTSACSDTYTVTYDSTAPNAPVANPAGGNYTGSQQVSLSATDTSGGSGIAAIYYTTDGTTPSSTNGTKYTGAITISTDTTLQAVAYDNAGNESAVMTETYGIAPVISGEGTVNPTTDSITLVWTTNEPATSRVVYGTSSVSDTDSQSAGAPNYGYAYSTVEDSTKVTDHSVTITGLTPGTTYYFRTVSHGSPESVSPQITGLTQVASTNGTPTYQVSFASANSGSSTSGAGGGTGTNGQAVLGASTTAPNNSNNGSGNGHVKGASTTKLATTTASKSNSGKFLGLGWWWLLILAILAAVGVYYSQKNKQNAN